MALQVTVVRYQLWPKPNWFWCTYLYSNAAKYVVAATDPLVDQNRIARTEGKGKELK